VVTVGLNDPHAADPQFAVQMRPAASGSLVAVAVKFIFPLTTTEAGIELENPTAIGVARIVRLTVLLCEGLLVTVAVIVTVVPIGTADGAVKTVPTPSAV
jgi:hypothetical protein